MGRAAGPQPVHRTEGVARVAEGEAAMIRPLEAFMALLALSLLFFAILRSGYC